jgi:hypothetical protein
MPTHDHRISSTLNTGAAYLAGVKNQLEAEKIRLNAAIRSYPSPIPACDAQFNHLLEKRTRLATELTLIDQLLANCHPDSRGKTRFEKLIADIHRIDPELAEKIGSAFGVDAAR